MAEVAAQTSTTGRAMLVVWPGLTPADTGAPVDTSRFTDLHVIVTGVDDDETVTMQGINDLDGSYATLVEKRTGEDVVLGEDESAVLREFNRWVRPLVSDVGSAQTTLLTVSMIAVVP